MMFSWNSASVLFFFPLRPLQPCVQYWPEPGLQQYGPMEVEFLSMSADEDVITRLFRVKNVTRVSHHAPPVQYTTPPPPHPHTHTHPLRATRYST